MSIFATTPSNNIIKIGFSWFCIFAAIYFFLEASFFCCSSYLFPYAARVGAGFGIYPLLQTSKSGILPKNYLAVFGDSYGFGEGDYFLERQQDINPKFNVTHFLREKSGGDFISFAIPGSSSLTGWIEDPIASMNYINATFFYHIDRPDKILLYFYEGNDVQGNYTDLQERYLANGYQMHNIFDRKYFASFIEKEMLNKNQINLKSKSMSFMDNLFFFKYAIDAINSRHDFEIVKGFINDLKDPVRSINDVIVNNKKELLPDGLAGPPLEMSQDDIEKSINFLDAITAYVRDYYRDSEISIIYIPSTLASYHFPGKMVNFYNPGYENIVETVNVYEKSNALCGKIRSIAEKNRMHFYDARPGLFKVGQTKVLHGPLDINHYNLNGYQALSDEIFSFSGLLAKARPGILISECARLPL